MFGRIIHNPCRENRMNYILKRFFPVSPHSLTGTTRPFCLKMKTIRASRFPSRSARAHKRGGLLKLLEQRRPK